MRYLALVSFAGVLQAQTSPVDSASRLNKAGRWMEAAQFARRASDRATDPDERCRLRVEMLTGLDKLGAFSVIPSELADTDSTCTANSAYATRKEDVDRIRANAVLPPLPRSGFDFTAVDRFFELADLYAAERDPSDAQWRAFFVTPGFRLVDRPDLRVSIELAFRPSLAAKRDSLLARGNAGAAIRYLRTTFAQRAALQRWRDTTPFQAIAQRAKTRSLALLPQGTNEPTPLVAFAVFAADGYSAGTDGVVIDYADAAASDLESFFAHEFHHSLNAPLSRINRILGSPLPEVPLLNAMVSLRNEGIADLIDKPYPYASHDAEYDKNYNGYYARTPAVLHVVDSLISIVAGDSTRLRAVGGMVTRLLIYGSHPTGAYMAREIYDTFGPDSLMPAVANPFAMFRTFAFAEARKGRPAPFSAKTVSVLDAIEKKHLRP